VLFKSPNMVEDKAGTSTPAQSEQHIVELVSVQPDIEIIINL